MLIGEMLATLDIGCGFFVDEKCLLVDCFFRSSLAQLLLAQNQKESTMHYPSFSTIQLNEMDRVKMMNRTDTKHWFHIDNLKIILDEVQENYFMLDINGESLLPYTTTYFDTQENQMYINHHNQKLNRFKIRKRTYVNSGISFLEIKFKSNKGRTIKKRISSSKQHEIFPPEEITFLQEETPFNPNELVPVLVNRFNRLMLVNKNFKERCTIDTNLQFYSNDENIELNNIAIVELKADGNTELSPLAKALRDHRLKSMGFSKYCTGRYITDSSLKQNRFKAKLRRINKTLINNI